MKVRPQDLVIRPQRPNEGTLARALLGEVVVSNATEVFIACHTGSPQILGAAATLRPPLATRPPSSPIHVVVAPPFRRRGIARALVEFAHDQLSRVHGIHALNTWFAIERGDEREMLMPRFSFARREKLAHYNADIAAYFDLMTATLEKLQNARRIPEHARIACLPEAPLGPLIDLQIRFIGGDTRRLEQRLRGDGVRPFHPELSRVCMLDREVCGFVLCRMNHEGKLVIDSRVVVPGRRRSWVSPFLLHDLGLAAARYGLTTFRFAGAQHHVDTHRVATRFDAPLMRIMDVYAKTRPNA